MSWVDLNFRGCGIEDGLAGVGKSCWGKAINSRILKGSLKSCIESSGMGAIRNFGDRFSGFFYRVFHLVTLLESSISLRNNYFNSHIDLRIYKLCAWIKRSNLNDKEGTKAKKKWGSRSGYMNIIIRLKPGLNGRARNLNYRSVDVWPDP